jgi:hypothetical protein
MNAARERPPCPNPNGMEHADPTLTLLVFRQEDPRGASLPPVCPANIHSHPHRHKAMKHKVSHTLFAYWNEIRGQRIAPRRFEIEPSRIASILPDTFILDCSAAGIYRFRLAGTRMSGLLGRDVRDGLFTDLFQPSDHRTVNLLLKQAIEQAPVSILTTAGIPSAPEASSTRFLGRTEIVLLPLYHTHDTVTRLLGSAAPLDAMPVTGPRTPLVHELQSHDIIWPDGRPHAILDQMNRQSPFAPENRNARIVTSNRRRFRVFDGGRAP